MNGPRLTLGVVMLLASASVAAAQTRPPNIVVIVGDDMGYADVVHTPMHATDKYLARFKGIADEQRRTYAAMMSAMDDGIGRTVDALWQPPASASSPSGTSMV